MKRLNLYTWGCGHIRRDYAVHRWCPPCASARRREWRHWMALGLATVVLLFMACAAVVR